MQRLLKKFVLLIVIINFNSCGSTPEKPSIDSGIVIAETNEVFFVNNRTSEERVEPICFGGDVNPELDKSAVHSNKHWGLVLTYIKQLESYVPRKVRKELRKVLKSNYKLQEIHKNGGKSLY